MQVEVCPLICASSPYSSISVNIYHQNLQLLEFLHIKPLQSSSSSPSLRWQAHSLTVLQCDWSAVDDIIVSGGEDGVYKVSKCT